MTYFLDKGQKMTYVLIVLAAFLVYGNTMKNDYNLDDEIVTGPANITAQGFSSIKEIFTDWYQNELGNKFDYRPMVKLSYAIENQIFGLSPGTHHFFNILFYIICCCLLFRFLLKLCDGKIVFPAMVTILFLLHPNHTEVVASLKNRDVLLVFIFSFLAGNILLKMFEKKEFGFLNYLFVLLLFFLAALSKRDFLVFLFVFPPLIFLKYKPKIGPVALVAVIIIASYLLMLLSTKLMVGVSTERRVVEFFESPVFSDRAPIKRILAFFNSAGFYFAQDFLPIKQVCYYGYNQIEIFSYTSVLFFTGFVGVGGSAFLFFKSYKKNFLNAAAIVFLIGGMFLYLNFAMPVPGIVADRFSFVSSIGACMLIVILLSTLFKKEIFSAGNFKGFSGGIAYALIFISLIFSFFVVKRNSEWKNKEVLFSADVKKAPNSAKLHSLYALELMNKIRSGELPEKENDEKKRIAISELRKSIDIYPEYNNSQANLAYLLLNSDSSSADAKQLLENALKIKNDNAEIHFNYAQALEKSGDGKKAEEELIKTIELKNDMKPAYDLLVKVSWQNKTLARAISIHKKALESGMREEFVFLNLGNCYARINDTLNAVANYDSAFAKNRGNKQLGDFLVHYYTKKGDKENLQRIVKSKNP